MAARIPDASRSVDSGGTDGAETNPFNESHFDRLREQGIIKSNTTACILAGVPDAPRTDDDNTDGAETNPDGLREQGVVKSGLISQHGVLKHEQHHDDSDAIPPRLGIHQLELEQAPQLRILFQEYEGDTKVTLTAEKTKKFPVNAAGTPNVLGAMHSRAEIVWSCKAGRINVTILPIPWKDNILLFNKGDSTLFVESAPNGLDMFEIQTSEYAVVYPGFWQLCNRETTLEILLRPRRYRLLLKDDAMKRTAEQPPPTSKRFKHSTGAAVTGAAEHPSSVAQNQKTIIRPTVVDVDMLTSIGLGQNQTLNVVDNATGQLEYSIKRIDGYLKRGDYTDVFKAAWKDGSSQPAVVAVKLHKVAAAAEPHDIAATARRWKRELEVHRYLEHPCIAKLLAFDSRLLSLVIEHRDSHDLATPYWCFPSGPDAGFFKGSLDDACHILADISSALAYFADQGLVHNDIKAGNILYRGTDSTANARAVVIDFGLSRNVKSQINDFGGGSPWYLAPEWMLLGRRGPLADVFSLGVVMLYLLRRITIPDKGRGWNVNAIQQHAPEAINSMTAWLAHVRRRGGELHGAGASSKETKVWSLVRRMLLKENTRISARDLANQSAEWAS
ncbi:hypothetical protein SLS53_003832 [Cytospora paraplurivora]|uniref:Protein kinase domain-containing protein n=1 Tax=Cytospora paraplurivora TaxID=2898453 RepID=A0AAN9UI08_9PEZI